MAAPGMQAMSAKPSQDAMRDFLEAGLKMMESQGTRKILKTCVMPPGKKLIELQREAWDTMGIDQEIGCNELETIQPTDEKSTELFVLKQMFVYTAMRTYLQSLEDRRPATLETKKAMPRDKIIEFFDACNTKMDLPETGEFLLDYFSKTKDREGRGAAIANLQRDQLEVLGYEREHGCRMLSRIKEDFPEDKELFGRMQGWAQKAQTTMVMVEQKLFGKLMSEDYKSNPMMAKAKEECAKMTPLERGQLIERMGKKVQVIAGLPAEARQEHMSKLADEERLEVMKAQILAFSVMQQQAEQMHMGQAHAHGHGEATAMPASGDSRQSSVAAPSQQEMM